MHDITREPTHPRQLIFWILALLGAAGFALVLGSLAGNPTPETLLATTLVFVALIIWWMVKSPFGGFVLLSASTFMFFVVAVGPKHASLFDVAMPFVLAGSWWGAARREALLGDRHEVGPDHARIRNSARAFERTSMFYFALAAVSIIPMIFRFGLPSAFDSFGKLGRIGEAALLYPLALWWLRSERRIIVLYHGLLIALLVYSTINIIQITTGVTERAGLTFFLSDPGKATRDPNEAGMALAILWALIVAMHQWRPRWWNFPLLGLTLFMLFLTQSRSGLLAFLTFNLWQIRRIKPKYLVATAIQLLIALPFVPARYWERLVHSITFERGSFDVYSFMVRVFGYITALKILTHFWLTGIGYLGFRFLSDKYNILNFRIETCENFWLESWVGMGITGLILVIVWFRRLYQMGDAVHLSTQPGTLGHTLGRLHKPLFFGLIVTNLTGENFVGLVGVGQLALWCAILVRAGHLGVDPTKESPAALAESGRPLEVRA